MKKSKAPAGSIKYLNEEIDNITERLALNKDQSGLMISIHNAIMRRRLKVLKDNLKHALDFVRKYNKK